MFQNCFLFLAHKHLGLALKTCFKVLAGEAGWLPTRREAKLDQGMSLEEKKTEEGG